MLEQLELITELRDHLVKLANTHLTSLSVSSRCRTCYRGRHRNAAWRRSHFNILTTLLWEISPKAYGQAEEHQAVVFLERTQLTANGPKTD